MKKITLLIITILLILAYRFANSKENSSEAIKNEQKDRVIKVLEAAKSYLGTPYKFGGTTSKGMDCSGLVYTVYKDKLGITLPRSSKSMSTRGEKIAFKNIKKGDLLFFDIDRLQGNINHVGLVIGVTPNEIQFIHSSTARGVVISTLQETYWENSFVKAKRIID